MRPERTEYLRQLAEAYDRLGQPAKALGYYKQYKAEADSTLGPDGSVTLALATPAVVEPVIAGVTTVTASP